jgi:hypothetical protein
VAVRVWDVKPWVAAGAVHKAEVRPTPVAVEGRKVAVHKHVVRKVAAKGAISMPVGSAVEVRKHVVRSKVAVRKAAARRLVVLAMRARARVARVVSRAIAVARKVPAISKMVRVVSKAAVVSKAPDVEMKAPVDSSAIAMDQSAARLPVAGRVPIATTTTCDE